MEDPNPKGTIVFTTVGRPYYGFDIFSVSLPSDIHHYTPTTELRLTDGISINFNGQFVDEDQSLVYISERTGSSQIFLNRPRIPDHQQQRRLPSAPESLFHDRPIIKNGRLYFVSAHQQPHQPFKSWSAIYTKQIMDDDDDDSNKSIIRLTPFDSVDYSPAISQSGKFIAVASYGSRSWEGEFHDLLADIVVFSPSHPTKRTLVCQHGGWPTWSGDSTIFFHREADDGWWSIFRIDLPHNFEEDYFLGPNSSYPLAPQRVTPPGIHCFTPAAIDHHGKQVAVATRRPETNYRHIEIFDVESQEFYPVTKSLKPSFHHYNPFVSPESGFLGYHRFRGESTPGESIVPNLDPVVSPINGLRMLRLNGSFPCFSPTGDLLAFNHDFDSNSGLKIVRSDGSKRWTLIKDRTAFYNAWSPTEKHVIYTSIGPIFESVKATVQIARVSFDPSNLENDDKEDIPVNIKILTRDDTGNNAFPACSPDGKSIVFRSGRSGHKNLYLIDAVDGEFNGSLRQLTDGPWIDTMPAWSPDGNLIAFSSNRHNPDNVDAFSIYVMSSTDGKDVRRIHVAGDRERINHVCFSGDGQWLLFTANIGGVTAEPVSLPNQFQPYGDLHIVRLDGSGLRRLTWNGYENGTPAWHPKVRDDDDDELLLCLEGDKLKGQFDEPLWIHCDLF